MKISSEEKLKQRAIIQFCVGLGHTPVQAMEMLNRSTRKPSVERSSAYKWHKRYSEGRETIMDDDRCGRPVSKSKTSDVKLVKDRLHVDWRVTMHGLCSELDMGYGTVHGILKAELNMSRVGASWVPRLLKNHEMERRVMNSKTFLRRFEKDGDAFLNRIIIAVETWLFYYESKTKQQSSQWKSSDSPPPKKARMSRSMGKHMFIVFFDIKGVI